MMGKVCKGSSSEFSLRDLTKIALGHSGEMGVANIAALHSVILGIIKKLGCENEVLTLTGTEAEELNELLKESKEHLLPCVQNSKMITERFDEIPELEKRVDELEAKLEEHLNLEYTYQDFESGVENESIYMKTKKTEKTEKQLKCLEDSIFSCSSTEEKLSHTPPLLQESPSFVLYSDFEKARKNMHSQQQQKPQLTLSKARRSEFFENWQKQVEFIKENQKNITMKRISAARKARFENLNKRNKRFCPQESILTIPSSEYDIPRLIIKSPNFFIQLKDIIAWPLERRLFAVAKKIEYLELQILDFSNKCTTMMTRDEHFQMLTDLSNVSLKISKNELTRFDTFTGMQDIFDMKVDKDEVPFLKEEIEGMINLSNYLVKNYKKQSEMIPAYAFIVGNTEKKNESIIRKASDAYEKDNIFCECIQTHPPEKRFDLLTRISRLNTDDLRHRSGRQSIRKLTFN